MRVDVFLLSDAATVAEGKLYVHGGGISRINAISLPMPVQLTLTVRVVLDAEEVPEVHRFSFSVTDPDGSHMLPPAVLETSGDEPVEGRVEGEEIALQFTLGMGLSFPRAGIYRFGLTVDEEHLRETRVAVVPLSAEEVERSVQAGRRTAPGDTTVLPNRAERRKQQKPKG